MTKIYVCLFGRLSARAEEQAPIDLEAGKAQELFCYLLLHRDRPQPREALASLLWGNYCTTAQSRKYLRQALWQLQTALNRLQGLAGSGMLLVETDWIQLRSVPALWLDVAVFEATYNAVRGVPGREVTAGQAEALEQAVDLYRGQLLESWPMDWCMLERERLIHMLLAILDKLIEYCEARGLFEDGLAYGERSLQIDRAREQTHRQMMRLYHRSGDRTYALRQFEHCVEALRDELALTPGLETLQLAENIRQNRPIEAPQIAMPSAPSATDILAALQCLQASLAETQKQLQQVVRTAELVFGQSFDI